VVELIDTEGQNRLSSFSNGYVMYGLTRQQDEESGGELRAWDGRTGLPLFRAGQSLSNRRVPGREHALALRPNFHFAPVV
jgi:hypothetical protein